VIVSGFYQTIMEVLLVARPFFENQSQHLFFVEIWWLNSMKGNKLLHAFTLLLNELINTKSLFRWRRYLFSLSIVYHFWIICLANKVHLLIKHKHFHILPPTRKKSCTSLWKFITSQLDHQIGHTFLIKLMLSISDNNKFVWLKFVIYF